MPDIQENNKRIAKNTLFLYFRMFILMVVTFYTSRVVLSALGVEDYGIYNVVGGVVSMLAFFTESLTNVSQRYLIIGLGKQNHQLTTNYFRQSLTILLLFSLIVVILGETIGLWFVMNKIVVPSERLFATFWVYQSSLICIICTILQVNFLATIIAFEQMNVYAFIGLIESFGRLAIAFLISSLGYDALIIYSCLTAFASIFVLIIYIVYCKWNYRICSIRPYWQKDLAKEMIAFTSANIFGCFAWSVGVQGSNVIMNMFFGPVVNAAKGVALQINAGVVRFVQSSMTAVKPQIIKSYTVEDLDYMFKLIIKCSRLSFFIAVLIAGPVIMEMSNILHIWLKEVPDFSVPFSRMSVFEALVSVFIIPLWIAANATGSIRHIQVYGRLFTLSALPLTYLFLCINPNPILGTLVCTIMHVFYWFYCIFDIYRQLHFNLYGYIKDAILPSLFLSLFLIFASIVITRNFSESTFSFLVLRSLLLEISAIGVIFILLDDSEKKMITKVLRKVY